MRQTRASRPEEAASRSRARKAGTDAWAISRAVWRSRTASGTSSRQAPGRGPSRSRQRRLAKDVRSAVCPSLTTNSLRPSGSAMAASIGIARYQRKRSGQAASVIAAASR